MLDGDRFIAEQLQGRLDADETIEHTAYLETESGSGIMGGLRKQAYWAALTPRRLLLIAARVGAFKPMLENKGVESIERSSITAAQQSAGTLIVALADGRRLAFIAQRTPKHASGQAGLIDELVARHGHGPLAVAIAKDVVLKKALTLGVAVLAVGFTAYQYFYGNRAEISVQCSSGPAGVECTASHTSGGAKAKACWGVELRCLNRAKAVAPACAEVDAGQARTVTIAEQDFRGLDACDMPNGLDVVNLRIEK